MSSNKPQVTITLGRTGQVVKRARSDGIHSDHLPSSGKRSIMERLGSNVGNHSYENQSRSKRQRRGKWDPAGKGPDEEQHISNGWFDREDLRYKLNKKNLFRRSQNDSDLREKLSQRGRIQVTVDTRPHMREQNTSSFTRRIPPTRSADDLIDMDSSRKAYSGWTLNGLRHRSPDRFISSSRGLSPQRNVQGLRQISSLQTIDAPRSSTFVGRGVIDAPRPSAYITKATIPPEAVKSVARHPPTDMMQKSSYLAEEPQLTVPGLLNSLGLGKYSIIFQAEEVDMTALKQMGDNDLKDLGIPMGPRKKILLAITPRRKQRQT
ncbi:hypothetical protein QJS10_CPB17g00606 [Acorus calamus]|uniref:SAM domain-containing protein n=1 Tax=Acorus calamus TaxID=4465 RepID=A0AAV9CSY7_ACOCL|nr:hypothetical protein QJS10_CPB17g00606 [Acorus calamus]